MSATVLSPRRVRALVAPGQRWVGSGGTLWPVVNVHRRDGLVALQGPKGRLHYVRFAELGRHYRLEDE